jgi:hypothetical protein
MDRIVKIKNDKGLVSLLISQYGQIFGIELGILICSFFVETNNIQLIQIVALPIIIILIFSKSNKPITYITIDNNAKVFHFKKALIGQFCMKIEIPFDDFGIIQRWKWLLNFYQEVLEIKCGDHIEIVIPINKSNSKFIEKYISEINLLLDSNTLTDRQVILNK